MSALFDYMARIHNKYAVGIADGGQAVCYDKAGPALHHLAECLLYKYLGTGIYRAGRLIEYEHRRQAEHHSCYAEKLFLACGQGAALV